MNIIKTGVILCAAIGLAACQSKGGGGNTSQLVAAAPLQVDFTWAGTEACSTKPPAFTVNGAPEGTAQLRFKMKDLDFPSYNHGGGTVTYSSPEVPAGAFNYKGPCPPSSTTHRYQWTIQAVDANGQVVAEGTVTKSFPP